VELEEKRSNLKQAFDEFMDREDVDDWMTADDVILAEIIITGLEIFTGKDGNELFKEIMTYAKATSKYHALGDYLSR